MEQYSTEQTEHPISPEKHHPPPEANIYHQSHRTSQSNNYEQSHGTPPHSQKRYDIMKDRAFLSSSVYPPILPSKPTLSTNRDVHLIYLSLTIVSSSSPNSLRCTFVSHPTDSTFKLYDKNQDFF